jgi:hypothetical protein
VSVDVHHILFNGHSPLVCSLKTLHTRRSEQEMMISFDQVAIAVTKTRTTHAHIVQLQLATRVFRQAPMSREGEQNAMAKRMDFLLQS